jgi:hypothetical protein
MATVSTHAKMLDEILFDVNLSSDVVAKLKSAYEYPYVKEYMTIAVSNDWPCIDIESIGINQYDYHRSMAGASLLNRQTFNLVNTVILGKLVKPETVHKQYKALSEMLFSGECKVLRCVLLKNIPSVYENITFEKISESLQ